MGMASTPPPRYFSRGKEEVSNVLFWGFPWGWGWPCNSILMSGGVNKNVSMTNLTMPNNILTMKFPLKSIPGLADVGVPHGVGDSPRAPPRCQVRGSGKNFKLLILLCLTIRLQ